MRLPLATLVLLAAPALAQTGANHVFVLDPGPSTVTWTGSVSAPGLPTTALVGQPTHQLGLVGAQPLWILASAPPIQQAFLGSGATTFLTTSPALSAIVPDPLPTLPPLVTINLVGLELDLGGGNYFPGPGGAFAGAVQLTVGAGSADVSVQGVASSVPLAGLVSPQGTITGTLTSSGTGHQLNAQLTIAGLGFTDPSSGATVTLDVSANLCATYELLGSESPSLSLASGGTARLHLSTGYLQGSDLYLVLASASGTRPGLPLGAFLLPLNPDPLFTASAVLANQPPFGNTFGSLDFEGIALATLTLPPASDPTLAGLTLHLAYAAIRPGTLALDAISNAEPIALVP